MLFVSQKVVKRQRTSSPGWGIRGLKRVREKKDSGLLCYPASFKGASRWAGPLGRVLVLHARSQPHFLVSAHTGAPQVTLSPAKLPLGCPGDSPGGSWLLQSRDKANGQGGAARMQTNSSSKVQAVPGADGSTDSSGSLCHNCCPATLTINRGALQGQPHGPVRSCPTPLGACEDIPENGPCVAPGATPGWTQQWPWGLLAHEIQHPSTGLCGGKGWAQGLAASLFPQAGIQLLGCQLSIGSTSLSQSPAQFFCIAVSETCN